MQSNYYLKEVIIMEKKKKQRVRGFILLGIGLLLIMIGQSMQGCVFAVPISEDKIDAVDDKLNLDGTLTQMFEDSGNFLNPENETSGSEIKNERNYSLRIYTSEEKDEIKVVSSDSSFTYGSKQIGSLTLSNDYTKKDNDYTYIKDNTIVSIDGFSLGGEDIEYWADFIKNTLSNEGYIEFSEEPYTDTGKVISLEPDDNTIWSIYLVINEDRIYITSIVCEKENKSVIEDIMNNRSYTFEE